MLVDRFYIPVVRNLRTIELIVKHLYNAKHETPTSSFDRRRHGGGDPACPVRSCARGDLRQHRRIRMLDELLEFLAHQRKGNPQIDSVAALQGFKRGRL